MIEFLLFLNICAGLWLLGLQLDCTHLRMQVKKQTRIIESQKNGMILLSEAIGEDVRKVRARLDTLERD